RLHRFLFIVLFFPLFMIRPPPRHHLFPYTTLFRSFTAEDPNFDADGAVRGFRTNRGIINICTQGVQRHAAFTVPFGTRDLGTTKDRKSTRLNSSHVKISYAVFCLKKKK